MSIETANERTFQGILLSLINKLIGENKELCFSKIFQEQNIGVDKNRFSDMLLYSSVDSGKKVLFELKDSKWDATEEGLVTPAMQKAFDRGYQYFVTGTPRQLAIYETFIPEKSIFERKLKIYTISNVKNNNEVISNSYENIISPKIKSFLSELSEIIHGIKEIQWDTIDKIYVNKLSSYILEASAEMSDIMYYRIKEDKYLRNELKKFLISQDIFNVNLKFDSEDVYKICQLCNYLLYLKIIFYSYLQRDVKALHLKPLEIPEDKRLLNKVLRQRFNDVLEHDFELIFKDSILDEFEYNESYIPVLKDNINEIKNLQYHDITCDIIGAIYNTLIDNQEQHHRGQHFTNTNEVDLINAFCINNETNLVLDSSCGAGTFLVRAYKFLKNNNPEVAHEKLLERLWGIDIAIFPIFLSAINLSLLNIKSIDNYPVLIHNDFASINSNFSYSGNFLNLNKTFEIKKLDDKHANVKIPDFDVCMGNPPYIRQELISKKDKKIWSTLARKEWSIKKINQQCDLYVYYLMHTAAFLKYKGRLGFVISASWLVNIYGTDLQKFLLDHFKIIAIIENQKVRSFETASINTIILILEKCNDRIERDNNIVRFVRIFADYNKFIGISEDVNRINLARSFVKQVENTTESKFNDDYWVTVRKQSLLKEESTFSGKYENGKWATKYLRAPSIYYKILSKSDKKFEPLLNYCEIRRGFTTGSNNFFYVRDDTKKVGQMSDELYLLTFGVTRKSNKIDWKKLGWYYSDLNKSHYLMENFYFKPLFKTQKEANNLDVDVNKLNYCVLICNDSKKHLIRYKSKIINYINDAEKVDIHKLPTCEQRLRKDYETGEIITDWYMLGEDLFLGDFIIPSKIGEFFRLIDNRQAAVYSDKVNYNIKVKDHYQKCADVIFLILNSSLFRFYLDLFSRQLTGSQTLSDVDVNVVEKTMIINPELILKRQIELSSIYRSLKSRPQNSIFQELTQKDRKQLDLIIFEELGLSEQDLNELYEEISRFISDRIEKSKSVTKTKTKKKLSYDEILNLVKDRFSEINSYIFLTSKIETRIFSVPAGDAKFPKDIGSGNENMFNVYKVFFKQPTGQVTVNFSNAEQMKLFYFIYKTFDVIGRKVGLPLTSNECIKILNIIENDYENYIGKIIAFLNSQHIRVNAHSIYRDLLFS